MSFRRCAGSRLFGRSLLGSSAAFGNRARYLLAGENAFDFGSAGAFPQFAASTEQIQATEERWRDFKQKARAGQPAEIELTADDLNSFIAANWDPNWKTFVSIEGNQLRLQSSLPLGEFFGRSGYYFNGDTVIQSNGSESLEHPQLNRIVVNNDPVPKGLLDWKYHSRRLREYLAEYRDSFDVGTVEIRDGKLILRSRSD